MRVGRADCMWFEAVCIDCHRHVVDVARSYSPSLSALPAATSSGGWYHISLMIVFVISGISLRLSTINWKESAFKK